MQSVLVSSFSGFYQKHHAESEAGAVTEMRKLRNAQILAPALQRKTRPQKFVRY